MSEKVIFQNLAEEWLLSVRPEIKESTNVKYQNMLKWYILPYLGGITLDKITYKKIKSYSNELLLFGGVNGTGLSAKTVSDVLSLVRNILRFAARTGKKPPCDGSSVHIKKNTKEMRVLSRGEQDKLCRYLYHNLDACNTGILICLFTGLRIGEICSLRWEDISISEKTIYIHRTMQRIQTNANPEKKTQVIITTPKSSCSIRKIPLSDELVALISKRESHSIGYFLTGSDQKYMEPRTMQNHFKDVLKCCDIDYANFHALRHTFATRCVEVGFDLKSLSELLGHASVNITMNRYVHPSMELKRENMQRLSPLLAVK